MKAFEFTTPLKSQIPVKLGLFSDIHCLDKDTEILTADGFKGYTDIKESDIIINYNPNTQMLEPQKINQIIIRHVENQDMYAFESKYMSFYVSDRHRMYVSQHNQKHANYEFVLAKDLNKFRYDVMNSGIMVTNKKQESRKNIALYELCVATICDGSWGNKNRPNQYISFHLNKTRKINKIKQLLNELGFPYRETHYDKSITNNINTTIYIPTQYSQKIFNIVGIEKNIPTTWIELSASTKRDLLKTWAMFDGTERKTRIELVNTNEHNIDMLQIMAITSGFSANKIIANKEKNEKHKTCFRVSTNYYKSHSFLSKAVVKRKYTGIMWCVNTNNGTIIIRRNGKIMIIGNCDSPDCDKETLKLHLDYCLQDKRYILINGDLFDAILLKDMKRAVPHNTERSDNQLNVKLEETAHFLTPYKDQILFMGRGNHEESIIKYNGLDLMQMLTTLLNAGNKHQIQYGNYANFLRFSWVNSQNKSTIHYDIYAHHGAGGSAPVTKGMIDFSRLSKGVNADLIWIGHKHQSIVDYSDPIMYIDQNGNVLLKNRQLIQTPSYQKGRTIDYNVNFAERFYSHTALSGFGELNLTPYYENGIPKIKSDIKITNKPQAILGQVISAKLNTKSR